MNRTAKLARILFCILSLTIGLFCSNASAWFLHVNSTSANNSTPVIYPDVTTGRAKAFPQGYQCKGAFDSNGSQLLTQCGNDFADIHQRAENLAEWIKDNPNQTIPQNLLNHYYSDGDPIIQDLVKLDNNGIGLAAPFPVNSWLEQSFWSRYRDMPTGFNVAGNLNCSGAGWNSCLVQDTDASFEYNQPVTIFQQPLGIRFWHPFDPSGTSGDPDVGDVGLWIFGNQKNFFYYDDPSTMKDGHMMASFKQSQYSDLVVRLAGKQATDYLSKTVTCTRSPNFSTDQEYTCTATFGSNSNYILPGQYTFTTSANVSMSGVNKAHAAVDPVWPSITVGPNLKSSTHAPQAYEPTIQTPTVSTYVNPNAVVLAGLISTNGSPTSADATLENTTTGQTSQPVTLNLSSAGTNIVGYSQEFDGSFGGLTIDSGDSYTLTISAWETGSSDKATAQVQYTQQAHSFDNDTISTQNFAAPSTTPNNVKLTWDVHFGNASDAPPNAVVTSTVTSSAPTYNYPIADAPTNILPNTMGAFSSHFTMQDTQDEQALDFSMVEGSPFIQFTAQNGAEPAITITPHGTSTDNAQSDPLDGFIAGGPVSGYSGTIDNGIVVFWVETQQQSNSTNFTPDTINYYALYVPKDSYWFQSNLTTKSSSLPSVPAYGIHLGPESVSSGNNHFVLALLPPGTNQTNALERAQTLAAYAFNYVDTTKVNYTVSPSGVVSTTFTESLQNSGNPVEDINSSSVTQVPDKAILGLFPHQYWQAPGDINVLATTPTYLKDAQTNQPLTYSSAMGDIEPIIGNSFTTQYQYHGILPYLPPIKSTDNEGINQENTFLDNYVRRQTVQRYYAQVQDSSTNWSWSIKANLPNNASCTLTATQAAPSGTVTCTNSNFQWVPQVSAFSVNGGGDNWNKIFFFGGITENGSPVSGVTYTVDYNGAPLQGTWPQDASVLPDPAYSNLLGIQAMGGYNTYAAGKQLNKMAQAAEVAKQMQNPQYIAMLNATESMFDRYFTGQAPVIYNQAYSNDPSMDQWAGIVFNTFGNYYFGYDPQYKELLGFPTGFGASSALNDHIFHYGYWVNAAAHLAFNEGDAGFANPNWMSEYKTVVDDLVNDYAPTSVTSDPTSGEFTGGVASGNNETYDLRSWDPYMGHAWASGADTSDLGPNIESSSEQINGYAGMILWGAATGNQQMTNEGIYLYTTAVHAAQAYWFGQGKGVYQNGTMTSAPNTASTHSGLKSNPDETGNYLADNFGAYYQQHPSFSGFAGGIAQAGMKMQLFFPPTGFSDLGINVLPVTGASLYLGRIPADVQQNYDAAKWVLLNKTQSFNGSSSVPWAPNADNNSWQGLLAEYLALANPNELFDMGLGINTNYWSPNSGACTLMETAQGNYNECMDDGETRVHTYQWLRSLYDYGKPNFDSQAPTDQSNGQIWPLYAVFEKDGEKTYTAFNPETTAQTVSFPNGPSFSVAADSLGVFSQSNIPVVHWDTPTLSVSNITQTSASLSWNAATTTSGTITYEIDVNGTQVATTTDTHYNLSSLTEGTHYSVAVWATEGQAKAGPASASFNTPSASVIHWTTPTVNASNITETSANLSWNAATSTAGTITYEVDVNGTQVATTTNTNYALSGLTASTNYTISIWATQGQAKAGPATTQFTTAGAVVNAPVITQVTRLGYPSPYVQVLFTPPTGGNGQYTYNVKLGNGTILHNVQVKDVSGHACIQLVDRTFPDTFQLQAVSNGVSSAWSNTMEG